MTTHIFRCGPSRNPFPTLLSLYDGTRCLGHLLSRGRLGWEAFNADDQSVGIFTTQTEAASALTVAQ
jgi:hypothetical protein